MTDDKSKFAPRDLQRVNIGQEVEVKYWTRRFACTRYQLESAVRNVGAMAKEVERELQRHNERFGFDNS
jgi:hypothetical protein